MKRRVHIYISGKVQGVFFRSAIKNFALKLNLTGQVRNLHNGSVEAVFEGYEDKILKMIKFCKRGPSGAKVTDVTIIWEKYVGKDEYFIINYSFM